MCYMDLTGYRMDADILNDVCNVCSDVLIDMFLPCIAPR
jgi:hypothetical protein